MPLNVLPVISRELRVGARSRQVWWLRVASAVVGCIFAWISLADANNPSSAGSNLFEVMVVTGFILVVCAGLLVSLDSLIEEKTEGTLGLLFLTPLSGLDVVLGKLFGGALRCVYALMAFMPIIALATMLGGVRWQQLVAAAVALFVSLLYALSVGMMLSALCHSLKKAMGWLTVIVCWHMIAIPLLTEMANQTSMTGMVLALFQPSTLVDVALTASTTRPYLGTAVVLSIVSFVMLILGGWWIPRAHKMGGEGIAVKTIRGIGFRKRNVDPRRRARMLERNPLYWLRSPRRVESPWLTAFTGLLGFGPLVIGMVVYSYFIDATRRGASDLPIVVAIALGWGAFMGVCFLLLVIATTANSWAEDRRNGALELLFSTAINVKQVISGHWLACLRRLGAPITIVCLVIGTTLWAAWNVYETDSNRKVRSFLVLAVEVMQMFLRGWDAQEGVVVAAGFIVVALVLVILTGTALAWAALYLSMYVRKPIFLPVVTIGAVLAPPFLGTIFFAITLGDLSFFRRWDDYGFTITLLVALAWTAVVVLWCMRAIRRHFRQVVDAKVRMPKFRRRGNGPPPIIAVPGASAF